MPEFDFGHFHIVGELGRGGMALVYEAVDTRTEETVALKILYPHLMSDESTIKRFQREADVASRLKHDYIVPVIDYGEHDNQIYIAMKYMRGNSLAELFVEPRAISMSHLVRILAQIASALDYAHEEGVIHRDLKLQNILLDDKNVAYLSDFGIARLVDGTRLTATGQIAGTPMYMSPEQIRGKPVDFHSDIYSFSVMSYLLLTGFYPFTGEDSLAIIHKHVKEMPPTPTEVNPELPEAVNHVLLRGLQKEPEARYDSTLAMVKALSRAIKEANLHRTTTRIDIHGINPVDSVEIDAVPPTDDRVQAAVNSSPGLRAEMLDSKVTSATITGQGAGGRIGFFGFAIIATLLLLAVAIIFVMIQGSNNVDQVNIAATNSRLQLELELTGTAMGSESSEDMEDEDGEQLAQTIARATEQAIPAPIMITLPYTASNGVIETETVAPLLFDPQNQRAFKDLDDGTPIQIIGTNVRRDYFHVILEDGQQGLVAIESVSTDVDIETLESTWEPPGRPENAPDNPRDNNPPPKPDGDNGDPGGD